MPDEQNDELTERQRFWLRHLRACDDHPPWTLEELIALDLFRAGR